GVRQGHIVECAGLGVRLAAIRYQEGGYNVVHRIPGPVEYGDVTLRYGLTASRELWNWFTSTLKGTVQRRNVSILILGTDGATEVTRWDLINAWPSEWRGAPPDALGKGGAVEEGTVVHQVVPPGPPHGRHPPTAD